VKPRQQSIEDVPTAATLLASLLDERNQADLAVQFLGIEIPSIGVNAGRGLSMRTKAPRIIGKQQLIRNGGTA
jgi:hypothetical protein